MSNFYEEYEPYYCNEEMPRCGTKRFFIDRSTREILNMNEIFSYGILMKRKYSKDFIEKGRIKFGCPQKWIDYAKAQKPGKGDIQEGAFAAYNLNDKKGIISGLANNPGSYSIRLASSRSDQVYLVDSRSITLPTYCFYTIRFGDFKIVKYGGSDFTAFLHISARYFRGLADGKNWVDSTKDSLEEQYVFVQIYNPEIFIKMIFDKLVEMGIDRKDIIYKSITYKNIDVPFKIELEHPHELFYKNKQFEDQHEGRIVVNSSNSQIVKFLQDNPIDIGSLEDICVLHNQYPAGGINCFIDLDL